MGKAGAFSRKPKKSKKKKGTKTDAERDPSPRVELLDEMNECTRPFKFALVELFGRFDTDGDKVLSEAELKAFSRAANVDNREFTEEELTEIKDFFDWKDGPNGGGLSLRGWLQMYMTQTQGDEEETWKDLYRLGYNGQLKLKPKPSLKAEGALQKKLLDLLELGEAGKLEAFVDAFVAPDVEEDDKKAFLDLLSGKVVDEDVKPGDVGSLHVLLAELRCCVTGDGVSKVEGDPEDGPLTFTFRSPDPRVGSLEIEREVVFVKEDGEWYADG